MNFLQRSAIGMFVLLGALAMSGCTGPSTDATELTPREVVLAAADEAKKQGLDFQYRAMEDGVVDSEDYDAAYKALASCYATSGLGIDPPVLNPVDGLTYIFDLRANGLAPEKVDEVQSMCLAEYWVPINGIFLSTNTQRMDEVLRTSSIDCMREEGFQLSGEELTFSELVGEPDATDRTQYNTARDCVVKLAHELFPEIPGINLSS